MKKYDVKIAIRTIKFKPNMQAGISMPICEEDLSPGTIVNGCTKEDEDFITAAGQYIPKDCCEVIKEYEV